MRNSLAENSNYRLPLRVSLRINLRMSAANCRATKHPCRKHGMRQANGAPFPMLKQKNHLLSNSHKALLQRLRKIQSVPLPVNDVAGFGASVHGIVYHHYSIY